MHIVKLECPNCGAPIAQPHPDKKTCFCANCGTKMLIDNGEVFVNVNINKKVETTKRIVDDAKIEEQKTDRLALLIVPILIVIAFIGLFAIMKWM